MVVTFNWERGELIDEKGTVVARGRMKLDEFRANSLGSLAQGEPTGPGWEYWNVKGVKVSGAMCNLGFYFNGHLCTRRLRNFGLALLGLPYSFGPLESNDRELIESTYRAWMVAQVGQWEWKRYPWGSVSLVHDRDSGVASGISVVF